MSAKKDKKRLTALWTENPHCCFCGKETVLPNIDNNGEPNVATIDHLRSRWSDARGKPSKEPKTVLACSKCNNLRNHNEMIAIPIDIIREKSKSPPAKKKKLIEVITKLFYEIKLLRKALKKAGLGPIINEIRQKAKRQMATTLSRLVLEAETKGTDILVGHLIYEPYRPQKAGKIIRVVQHVGSNYDVEVKWVNGETTIISTRNLNDFEALITDHTKKLNTHLAIAEKLKVL